MTKIYHNPRCSKSRQTLSILQDRGEKVEIIEYLTGNPTYPEIKEIIHLLGIKPIELIRKSESEFKDHFKNKNLSDDEWIQAMIDYPKLIERPIVIKNGKAAIGRPPQKIIDIL